MKHIKPILYGTSEYNATLALRNKVMRLPLGLDIYQEDFSSEKDATILGMFDGDTLLGVGVMSHHEISCKVEYLCIDSALQSCGIGGQLLDQLEQIAKQQGAFLYCPHNLEQFIAATQAPIMGIKAVTPTNAPIIGA